MERFRVGKLHYEQKAQKILKFQLSQGRQKIKVFPQGTYMAQSFIPETSTILYYITEGISINSKESNGSLKPF